MANAFTPDNSQPCAPSLGNTGECGGGAGGPVRAPISMPDAVANCGSCGDGGGAGGAGGSGPGGGFSPTPIARGGGAPPPGILPMDGPIGPVGGGTGGGG